MLSIPKVPGYSWLCCGRSCATNAITFVVNAGIVAAVGQMAINFFSNASSFSTYVSVGEVLVLAVARGAIAKWGDISRIEDEFQRIVNSHREELESIQNTLEQGRQARVAVELELQRFRSHESSIAAGLSEAARDGDAQGRRVTVLEEQNRELSEQVAALTEMRGSLESNIAQLRDQIVRLEAQTQTVTSIGDTLQSASSAIERDASDLEAQLQTMTEALQQRDHLLEQLNTEMNALREAASAVRVALEAINHDDSVVSDESDRVLEAMVEQLEEGKT